MLRKAKKRGFPTILARWQEQESYRSSLKDHDIGGQQVIVYDRFALERHDFSANHLDNYAQMSKKQNENANDCKTNSWQQNGSASHTSTQVMKDVKIRINNFKDLKNMTTLLIGRLDGGGFRSNREVCRILRLRRLYHGKTLLGNGSHGGGISRNMFSSE